MKKILRRYLSLIITLIVGFAVTGLLYEQSLRQHREKTFSEFNTESEVFGNTLDLIISSQIIRLQNFEESIEEEIFLKPRNSRFINAALRNSVFSAFTVFRNNSIAKDGSLLFLRTARYEIPNEHMPPYMPSGSGLESPLSNLAVKTLNKTGAKFLPYIGRRDGFPLFVVAWHSTVRPKYYYFVSGTTAGLFEKATHLGNNSKILIKQKLDGSTFLVEPSKGNGLSLKSITLAEHDELMAAAAAVNKLPGNYSQNYFEMNAISQATLAQYDWPVVILLIGIVITILLALLLFALVNRNIEIKKVVDERTADLIVESSKAKEAAYVKTRFLANTSHEIRSPLNIILGMADMLRESGPTTRQLNYIDNLQTAGNHLLNLINDILEMARVDSNDVPFKYSRFSMIDFMEQVAKLIHPSVEKKDLQLYLDIDPELPTEIETDPGRLRQVLINFVNNAVKFTDTGFIRLEARVLRPADQMNFSMEIEFRITDTGPGIPEDAKSDIFKAFYQVNPSLTRLKGGVGLGLSIVQAIVDRFGGKIDLQSEIRKGSTFSVRMPIHATNPLPWVNTFKSVTPGLKVLIVSDNLSQVSSLVKTLESCHFNVDVLSKFNSSENSAESLLTKYDFVFSESAAMNLAVSNQSLPEKLLAKFRELHHPILPKEFLYSLGDTIFSNQKPEKPEAISPVTFKTPDLSLLIVDDDPSNRILMQAYLKDQKWRVRYAASGEEALDLCDEEYPDILITDLQMPTMDGFTLISHIRQMTSKKKDTKNPKFVILTADALPETADYAKTTKIDCYLTKPIRKKDLIETILTI